MKKYVLIPDSFKGTMSSKEICEIMSRSIHRFDPEAQTVSIPVADGGEGSVDAYLSAMDGQKVYTTVKGPYGEDMQGFYGVVDGGKTAIIEMAVCAGLPLVGDRLHPDQTTTYGVGQLMVHAAEHGCRKMILALGGSCTNDAGAGAAAAAGTRFLDAQGNSFVPVGATLSNVAKIDDSAFSPSLREVEIHAMCDIDNPLFGENGAAYVFGPQKGADQNMVQLLDEGLRHLSEMISKQLHLDISQIPGAGAAGGMGGGAVAFFGARLQMGIDVLLDTVNFESLAEKADFIFTGEGRLDTQSLRGKVVVGVARRAKKQNIPVLAVVGDVGDSIDSVYDMGVSAVFSINRVAVDFKKAKLRSKDDLSKTMDNIMRLIQLES
ncbi:glycerate kinase [Caproiciproducens sp. NJN-50]|uniref:glycerate kinase family protein n=1 Tax=Caproiciproducens sp. NJN-50 TaxID=2507162 RepID=UPI000FFE0E9E|nr:glycerate kinase [Caproiciproducens sp. NJN-50]QAT48925.1 glycerate kinase [Caproiciproducens sp. NJN-50]